MSHNDRIAALIEGHPVDRPPVSLWRHFYKDEDDLDKFVEAMVGWQRRFDWDFLKINPRASYHYEPWGVVMRPSPDSHTKPERVRFPINNISDWAAIRPLPVNHPLFDFQLRAITRIRKALPRPFKIVMTVFNPISIAGDMVASDAKLLEHLRHDPSSLESALRAITQTFVSLVHEFRNAGADGLFFATTQWASRDRLTPDELRQFVLPFDRQVWDSSGADAFNVLHVCDRNIMLEEYRSFGASLTNWDVALEKNPSMTEGHELLGRPVMGGLRHGDDLLNDSPQVLHKKTRRLVDEHRGIAYAVGPGCAIPVATPDANVAAIRAAVEQT